MPNKKETREEKVTQEEIMKKAIKVLIACEESQTICKAFRKQGFEAYSCDIQEPSGGHPEWHILGDAQKILSPQLLDGGMVANKRYGIEFITMDKQYHYIECWNLLIAHPPCTYLSKAGANRLVINGEIQIERYEKGVAAANFFETFLKAPIKHIAVENPVPMKIFGLRPYTQIIHPWMFGHEYTKITCLWLKNLPPLFATDIVVPEKRWVSCTDHRKVKKNDTWAHSGCKSPKERSKTFPGIANAMVNQWGALLLAEQHFNRLDLH